MFLSLFFVCLVERERKSDYAHFIVSLVFELNNKRSLDVCVTSRLVLMFNPNIETGNKVKIFGLSLHLLHLKLSASNPSANFAGDWPFFDF